MLLGFYISRLIFTFQSYLSQIRDIRQAASAIIAAGTVKAVRAAGGSSISSGDHHALSSFAQHLTTAVVTVFACADGVCTVEAKTRTRELLSGFGDAAATGADIVVGLAENAAGDVSKGSCCSTGICAQCCAPFRRHQSAATLEQEAARRLLRMLFMQMSLRFGGGAHVEQEALDLLQEKVVIYLGFVFDGAGVPLVYHNLLFINTVFMLLFAPFGMSASVGWLNIVAFPMLVLSFGGILVFTQHLRWPYGRSQMETSIDLVAALRALEADVAFTLSLFDKAEEAPKDANLEADLRSAISSTSSNSHIRSSQHQSSASVEQSAW